MKRESLGESPDSSIDEFNDVSLDEVKSAINEHLEAHEVSLSILIDEIEDAVDYSRYLALESTGYRKVWYNLHIYPDSSKWPNVLLLCELVFCLPFSNSCVEQMFSCLKLIKTNNRMSLSTDTLDDLLEINVEGPAFTEFSADSAVELWWQECCTSRRPNQPQRKLYKPRMNTSSSSTCTSDTDCVTSSSKTDGQDSTISLDEWDNLFDAS